MENLKIDIDIDFIRKLFLYYYFFLGIFRILKQNKKCSDRKSNFQKKKSRQHTQLINFTLNKFILIMSDDDGVESFTLVGQVPLPVSGVDYQNDRQFAPPSDLASRTLVLDLGSCSTKAGWAHEERPRLIFPSETVKASGV